MMQIQLEESATKGSFFIIENDKRLAEMTFSKSIERIIIDHTEVSDSLRGKNIGKQLVAASVDYARKNNVKILPLCPFAKAVFSKVHEYSDVLDT
jgi:uncharacterized protein